MSYTVVDPMHNLFLGTGKHMFKVWIDNAQIESKISKFRTPINVGRVPANIASGYTVEQLDNSIFTRGTQRYFTE